MSATSTTPPRTLADGVHWFGECLEIDHQGEALHAYSSAYLVQGDEASLIVDTGHPKDWAAIEAQLDGLHAAGAPPVRYLFPTHAEVPHAANLGRLLHRYPEAIAVGDVRDYHLFFPEFEDRLVMMAEGEAIDLGGRRFLLLEAVIKDLVTSLWGYDDVSRTLFPGDGFAYMHHHRAHECWRTAEELPELPIPEFTALFAEYALYWTRFTDIEPQIEALDRLMVEHPVEVIAPGHGSPLVEPALTIQKVKRGLRLGSKTALNAVHG